VFPIDSNSGLDSFATVLAIGRDVAQLWKALLSINYDYQVSLIEAFLYECDNREAIQTARKQY
jgi:hypothetical protein